MFRDPLSDLIRRTSKVEVVKDEKTIKVAVIAANLALAEATRPDKKTQVDLDGIASTATRAADSVKLSQAKILWVDDNPDNNRYERSALEALGVRFELATDTEEALRLLKNTKFNLVISDFARRNDSQGGYTLLDQLKKLPSPIPFIIYSSSSDSKFEQDAKSRGAYAETNSPQRLFDLVVNALVS